MMCSFLSPEFILWHTKGQREERGGQEVFMLGSLRWAALMQDGRNMNSYRRARTVVLEGQPKDEGLRCPAERPRFLSENLGGLSLLLSIAPQYAVSALKIHSSLISLNNIAWNSIEMKIQNVQTSLSAMIYLLCPSCKDHCFVQSARAEDTTHVLVTLVWRSCGGELLQSEKNVAQQVVSQ